MIYIDNVLHDISFYGEVVIMSTSHTEGPQFNPGWKQILTIEYVIVIHIYFINSVSSNGDVAQMVERSLSM